MNASVTFAPEPRKPKVVTLSSRQRILLHRLLHRELRKCSAGALEAFRRFGWVLGSNGGFQLTEQGRRVAEFSELTPSDRDLILDLP
jgi:hypothetical protein